MQTLRKRLSYDEMVDYVENDKQKIKFPNRQATFLRNSPFLSQFDGDSFIDLEEQENKMNRERLKEVAVRNLARDGGITHRALQYQMHGSTPLNTPSETSSDSIEDAYNELDLEENKRNLEERVRKRMMQERLKAHLKDIESASEPDSVRGSITSGSSIKSGSSISPESLARYNQPYQSESRMKELARKGLVEYIPVVDKYKRMSSVDPSSNLPLPKRRTATQEQSSSSTSKPVYPMGVNAVPLPEPKQKQDPKQKPDPKPKGRPAGSTNKPKDKSTMERILFGS